MNSVYEQDVRRPMICWKSVIAGLFVTFLAMTAIGALGMAFGGIGLYDGTTFQSASIFAGVWFIATVAISLIVGSFFAARISGFETRGAGSAQGIVVASLIFAVLMYQAASTVGWLGRTAGNAVSGTVSVAAQGIGQASESSMMSQVVEDTLGNVNIPPEKIQAVVTGTATRLLNGDTESAKLYLSRQTGITEQEADARIVQARAKVEAGAVKTREVAAKTMQTTGFTILGLLIIGTAAAALGGMMGARRRDIVVERAEVAPRMPKQTPSYV